MQSVSSGIWTSVAVSISYNDNLYTTGTSKNIYIYIYMYIVIHRQTVSLYHNPSVWLDKQDVSRWDRNPPNFTLDLVSYHSVCRRHTSARDFITPYVLTVICLHFCVPDTRVLNSLEGLCITRVASVYWFVEVLNPRKGSVV